MADRAAVLAWVREKYTPGQPIFVAPVAQEFFSGDLIAAKEFMEGLVGDGLVQVPRGEVSLFELPDSTPPPSAPSSDDEEYTLEQARAGWAEISAHRSARGLGRLRDDPRVFSPFFGTTASAVDTAMAKLSIKSKEFRQLVMRHAPAVAAHLDVLSQEVAGQDKGGQKAIQVLFPALLKDRAEKLNPEVLVQFSQAGLSTTGAIVAAINAQDGIIRLALETARLVNDDELGDAITKFQQQDMSWMQICAEVALLLSDRKRKAEAAGPAAPPDGNGHHPRHKNLYPIFQSTFKRLWQNLRDLDVDSVFQKSGINSFNDLQVMVQGTNNDLEEALDGLGMVNAGLGQSILEAYAWLSAYNQGMVNSRDARLVDVRHAWQEICAFPEVVEWGVSFPGQLVERFCNLLESLHNDLAAALAKQATDPKLQRLLAIHLLSFQVYEREMMTSEDILRQARRPSPPPPGAGEEERGEQVPTFIKKKRVRGAPEKWEELSARVSMKPFNFGSQAELEQAVSDAGGSVFNALKARVPSGASFSAGVTAMVMKFLEAQGVSVVRSTMSGKKGHQTAPPAPVPAAGASPSTATTPVEPSQALAPIGPAMLNKIAPALELARLQGELARMIGPVIEAAAAVVGLEDVVQAMDHNLVLVSERGNIIPAVLEAGHQLVRFRQLIVSGSAPA